MHYEKHSGQKSKSETKYSETSLNKKTTDASGATLNNDIIKDRPYNVPKGSSIPSSIETTDNNGKPVGADL